MTRFVGPLLAALTFAMAVHAQPGASPSELRRENDQLRERVHELEAATTRLQEEVDQLTATITALRSELAAALQALQDAKTIMPVEPDTTEEEAAPLHVAPPETEPSIDLAQHPFASPAALYEALKREYAAALGEQPFESSEEHAQFLRDARRWVNQIKLNRRSAVTWEVELESSDRVDTQIVDCMFKVIWPETGEPFGEAFLVRLSGRDAIRVLESPDTDRWILEANLAARPVINETRADAGVFNAPRLIGPFVEFDYDLSVRSIRPASNLPESPDS
jgi:outer membrane murein-binding lipoprotein Lpp